MTMKVRNFVESKFIPFVWNKKFYLVPTSYILRPAIPEMAAKTSKIPQIGRFWRIFLNTLQWQWRSENLYKVSSYPPQEIKKSTWFLCLTFLVVRCPQSLRKRQKYLNSAVSSMAKFIRHPVMTLEVRKLGESKSVPLVWKGKFQKIHKCLIVCRTVSSDTQISEKYLHFDRSFAIKI